MPTDFAQQALDILRDGAQFQWYLIPLLAIVVYIYNSEIYERRWNLVFAGLAFWGADWINDIKKQAKVVGVLWAIVALLALIFGLILGWI